MKILFVSQYFHPELFSNNNIVSYLVEQGHEVEVVTAIPNYPHGKFFDGYGIFERRKEIIFGAKVTRLPVVPRGNGSLFKLSANYLSFAIIGGLWGLSQIFKEKPDIIFCSQSSPITMAIPAITARIVTQRPLILWTQDLWPESIDAIVDLSKGWVKQIIRKWINSLSGLIYRNCDYVFIQSKLFMELIEKRAPNSKIVYWPNTTEPDIKFNSPKIGLRDELGIDKKATVLAYAGNIGETQNPEIIAEAAFILKDENIVFLIMGNGRAKHSFEKRVEELGVQSNFIFTGRLSIDKVSQNLSISDAALLTLKNIEVFSLTVPYRLQSFLASGKPIISCGGKAAAAIIKDANCGFTSKPGDAQAFADNIKRFLTLTKKQKNLLSKNSVIYGQENFSREKVFSQLENLLRKIVAGRQLD